jgi:hypothetical protein
LAEIGCALRSHPRRRQRALAANDRVGFITARVLPSATQ